MRKANELDFLNKFDSGYQFNEDELASLTWETDVIDEIKGEADRWTRSMETIFRIGNRCFAIYWEKGLPKCKKIIFASNLLKFYYTKML